MQCRCNSPTTFMSNMLYASSVLYKSSLPMVIVFNKVLQLLLLELKMIVSMSCLLMHHLPLLLRLISVHATSLWSGCGTSSAIR